MTGNLTIRKKLDKATEGHEGVGFSAAERKGKPDDTDEAELSAEDLAARHWEKNFEGCRSEFPDQPAYARFLSHLRTDEEVAAQRKGS